MELVPLWETDTKEFSPPTSSSSHTEERLYENAAKRQLPSARQEESEPEPNHAGSLISNFQPPELLETTVV